MAAGKNIAAIIFSGAILAAGAHAVINRAFRADREIDSASALRLSEQKYAAVKNKFIALAKEHDPRLALETLRKEIISDEALARSCHILTHEIGQAAYEKFQDFTVSIKYHGEICNSGYLHGVIESHFSHNEDIFSAVQTVCADYPSGKFLAWECYHGVGHGLMYYTANDLPRSLSECRAFMEKFASTACINGVFMENFNTDQKLHPSGFLRSDDPFFPCNDQRPEDKAECYLYAPSYYLNLNSSYQGALEWCGSAEEGYETACAQGVGMQMVKENINNPKFAEIICMSAHGAQTADCIKGMSGLYIYHHGSLAAGKKLCASLERTNRRACEQAVREQSSLFN